MTHNSCRRTAAAISVSMALAMTACFGGDDDDVSGPVSSADALDAAGTSGPALVSYLLTLVSNDETSEPSPISSSFAVPPDETNEPQPLI